MPKSVSRSVHDFLHKELWPWQLRVSGPCWKRIAFHGWHKEGDTGRIAEWLDA